MDRSRILTVSLALLLAACGGGGAGVGIGGGLADTGVGGSGGVVGPAQGFGSIIINDLVMNIDDAEFEIDGEPAGIGRTGQSRLAEGQQLVIRGDVETLDADTVFYRADIRGPITALTVIDPLVGAARLTVLGQTVRVNSATRYDGAAFDTLQVGQELEFSGARTAGGELVATYVGAEDPLAEYRVVGRVSSVAAPGFTIAGLAVDVQTAGLAAPAVGQLVEVRFASAGFVPGATVAATSLEILSEVEFDEGERYDIQGFIDSFSSASRFTVGGVTVVVLSGTEFEDGDAADLGLDVRVEVEGDSNAAGELEADRIIFKPIEGIRVAATVRAVDQAAGTVSTDVGVTFAVRALTELEDESDLEVEPFTLADLGAGDFIEARGFLDGTVLVAAEIERENFDPLDPEPTALRAPADAAPTLNGDGDLELSLFGVTVVGADGITEFEDDRDEPVTQSEFAALVSRGTVVEAEWDVFDGDTTQTADRLSIEEEDDD